MTHCDVKFCRNESALHHVPLGMYLCLEHWAEYCDGKGLKRFYGPAGSTVSLCQPLKPTLDVPAAQKIQRAL